MKGAIASVEIYAFGEEATPRRLTLTIAAPTRCGADSEPPVWECRVVLADLHRPEAIVGRDSVEALSGGLALANRWVSELRARGLRLTRDRAGEQSLDLFSAT